jgi:transcriptional regulator with XRE-family HTH domain
VGVARLSWPAVGANRLREAREREGLSRAALARSAGLNDKTLQRAEAGDPVSSVTLNRIVKALNRLPDALEKYTIERLFGEESEA